MKNNVFKKLAAVAAAAAVSASAFGTAASAEQEENLLIGAFKKGAAIFGNSEGDFGYEGTLNLSFDKQLTEGVLEEPLKDVTAKINSAYSGDYGASGVKLVYGGENLCTIEVINDDAEGKCYIRIPELSEEYLKFDMTDLYPEEDFEDEEDYVGDDEIEDWEVAADGAAVSVDFISMDWQAIFDGFSDYGALVYDKLGAGESGEFDLNIKDADYKLTSVSYTLDSSQTAELIEIISEAAETDENMQALASFAGYDSFEDIFMFTAWDEAGENTDEYFNLKLISCGENLCGAEISSEYESNSFVIIPGENGVSVQFSDRETDGGEYVQTQTDTFVLKNDESEKVTADIYIDRREDNGDYYKYTNISAENALVTENSVSGSISYVSGDSDGAYTEIKASGDIGREAQNIQAELNDGEVSLIKASYTGSVTDIPEIVVPNKSYDINNEDELKEYFASADIVGFSENARSVLGSELYQLIIDSFDLGGDIPSEVDSSSADVSSACESSNTASAAGTSAAVSSNSKSADASPETGAAAAGAASLIFIAAAIAVKKRK